jgi:hypothetical protein
MTDKKEKTPSQIKREKNLRPTRKGELSTEEAKKRGSAGGKASVKARREKKFLSNSYAEIIAELHDQKIKKGQSLKDVVKDILYQRNAATVSMLKEMREATEGSKIKTETTININSEDPATKAVLEKHGIKPKD